ncbi:hypothetical protein ACJVDH_11250 [Pedobacter sp. AW1-32]|uniref:hypothetical protein n=1 Tax=Pedobacter sp. AW1-32 TaxID=3383026 RepID=UPI003FEE714B
MTGMVLAYNRYAKVGLIEDENGQRIKYYNNIDCTRGDLVEYEIDMSERGIVASKIKPITLKSEIKGSVFLCTLHKSRPVNSE